MKTTKWLLFLVLVLVLVIPGSALAAGNKSILPDRLIIGENYTLGSGQTLDGNLWIMGGNVTLEPNSTVTGGVQIMGGTLEVNGAVEGDINAMGGYVRLGNEAHVQGNVNLLGGSLDRDSGAQVDGQVNTETGGPIRFVPPAGTVRLPRIELALNPIWQVMRFFLEAFVMAALAVLVVLFAPKHVERTAHAVIAQPLVAGGLGLLTLVVALIVLVAITITIILIPVTVLTIILLTVSVIFGWIALGMEVGQRIAQMFKVEWALPVSAGLGTLFITIVVNAIAQVPCLGWLAPALVIFLGLGGVLLTRFGTLEYLGGKTLLPPSASVSVAPVMPVAPVAPQAPETPETPVEPVIPPVQDESKE
jgi:cytoskeletal protein CcmA (bactofilin family)